MDARPQPSRPPSPPLTSPGTASLGLSEQLPPSPSPSLGTRSSAEGRPGHSRSSRSSREADALCQPPPRSVTRRPTRLCLRLLSGDRHHFRVQHRPSRRSWLCGGAPLTPAPGDLSRDLRWAAGRACAQGERARAREAARCGLLLPQPRSCCTPLLLARVA